MQHCLTDFVVEHHDAAPNPLLRQKLMFSASTLSSRLGHDSRFACQFCHKGFRFLSHLTEHLRTHTKVKPFSCSLCSKSFVYKSDLMVHIRTHVCSFCCQHFSRSKDLREHVCNPTLPRISNMRQNVHLMREPPSCIFKCDACPMLFLEKTHLVDHLFKKHVKRFVRFDQFLCR